MTGGVYSAECAMKLTLARTAVQPSQVTSTVSPSAICGSIASLEYDDDVDRLHESVSRARVFAGYAGWGTGQLEDEIEEEAWFIEPALPADVFSADPERLWSTVLERMGDQYRLLARMPDDPRMN